MLPPFDIFRVEDEIPRWLETAETLGAAKARITELAKIWPESEFVIFSQQTQNRIAGSA
jgi:type II secretory pathway component PulL